MKVVNTYEEVRPNWYSWTVFIQGSDDELSLVKHVTYLLHESFPNRRLVATDKESGFARSTAGWGEFLLRAEATMKDGKTKKAKLWLDLGIVDTKKYKQKYTGEFK